MDQADAPSKVKLGRSNLDESKNCFGASGLGSTPLTYGYSVDEASAHSTLRVIFDSPINFLDTSRNYGSARSEERIGNIISERGGLPEGFIISTKLDRNPETNRLDAAQANATHETLARVQRVKAICQRHNIPLGAAALNFSIRDGRIASMICGVSQPERIQQTLEWAQWPVPNDAWTELMALPFDTHDPEENRECTQE